MHTISVSNMAGASPLSKINGPGCCVRHSVIAMPTTGTSIKPANPHDGCKPGTPRLFCGVRAYHQVSNVDEPEHQRSSKARFPDPPYTPYGLRPDRAGYQSAINRSNAFMVTPAYLIASLNFHTYSRGNACLNQPIFF